MTSKERYQHKIPPTMPHNRTRYSYGCRCLVCKESEMLYMREYRAERKRKEAWEKRYGRKDLNGT